MSLLHKTRTLINRLFLPLGVALVRVKKQPWFRPSIVTTPVGRFSIKVPLINPVSTYYVSHPNYTSHLGRLTKLLANKYPQTSVVDIGANVGDTACIIKSAADVPVLCIEGDPSTFGFLEENLRQFKDVKGHNVFLGEKSETRGFNLEKGGWNTTLIPEKHESAQQLQLISLDDFMAAQPDQARYKLIKIDTEGFDCSILRGAKKFLRQVQPVITFEYNRENMSAIGEQGLETLFLLGELGYSRIVFHDEDGRYLCSSTLADRVFITDLHHYADGKNSSIYYYDLTVFPTGDGDIAEAYTVGERSVSHV